jgi:hypothetical protein
LPKRFACWICAVAMKLSMLEKPAPIWKVPVGFSVISTLTLMSSGSSPCSVERSTRSK